MDDEHSQATVPVLVIAGPTAVGKTEIGLRVARALHGEIISVDSAAVFRGLDIGTAKPSLQDRAQIAHHMIDVVDPQDVFSVADFQQQAAAAMVAIQRRGHLPVIVGGTGLWIRALIRNYDFPKEADRSPLRQELAHVAARYGLDSLARQLRVIDPRSYAAIHPNDQRRLIRAIEVFQTTGKRLVRDASPASPFRAVYWVMTRPIAELNERIALRSRMMIESGLVGEVANLLRSGVSPRAQSVNSIGYRETIDYLYGRLTERERDDLIIRHTQQFARRQLTWFRSEKDARWLDLSSWSLEEAEEKIVAAMQREQRP